MEMLSVQTATLLLVLPQLCELHASLLLRIFMACNFVFGLAFLNTCEIAAVLKPLVVHCVGHNLYNFNLCISFFLLELQCIIEGAYQQCWRVVGNLDVCRCKAYL